MCSLLFHHLLQCDVQAPDEASVIAEAKARLPSEPSSSDPNGCRIGEPFHHFSHLFSVEIPEFCMADLLFCALLSFSKYCTMTFF